jgi:hypothetical protein
VIAKSKIFVIMAFLLPWTALLSHSLCDAKPGLAFGVLCGVIGAINLYRAVYQYRADLKFYKATDDATADSGVKVTFKPVSAMDGNVRLFQYYPFVFFACGVFLVLPFLQFNCTFS